MGLGKESILRLENKLMIYTLIKQGQSTHINDTIVTQKGNGNLPL
jgi:hypothetical protein